MNRTGSKIPASTKRSGNYMTSANQLQDFGEQDSQQIVKFLHNISNEKRQTEFYSPALH